MPGTSFSLSASPINQPVHCGIPDTSVEVPTPSPRNGHCTNSTFAHGIFREVALIELKQALASEYETHV
jgi:hypothetical protein